MSASKGSALSLKSIGCVLADNLSPQKARILLMLALAHTRDPAILQTYFDRWPLTLEAGGCFEMRVYRITRDVTGDAYRLLLESALEQAATFSLVWRDQLRFAATATAVREALRPLQVRHVKRNRWPGTVLVGHDASVVTYRASSEALATLLEPGSLFAWRSPAYPEDLSFSSDHKTVCLATVSHEAAAWILSRSLASAIGSKVPLVAETVDEEYFRPT